MRSSSRTTRAMRPDALKSSSFRGALLCGDRTVAHSRRCVGLSNGLRPVGVSAVLPKVLPVTYIQIIFGDVHSEPRPRIHHAHGSTTPKGKPRSTTKQAAFTQAAFTQPKSPALNLGQAPTAWLATHSSSRAF
jgi:hypothetical protein